MATLDELRKKYSSTSNSTSTSNSSAKNLDGLRNKYNVGATTGSKSYIDLIAEAAEKMNEEKEEQKKTGLNYQQQNTSVNTISGVNPVQSSINDATGVYLQALETAQAKKDAQATVQAIQDARNEKKQRDIDAKSDVTPKTTVKDQNAQDIKDILGVSSYTGDPEDVAKAEWKRAGVTSAESYRKVATTLADNFLSGAVDAARNTVNQVGYYKQLADAYDEKTDPYAKLDMSTTKLWSGAEDTELKDIASFGKKYAEETQKATAELNETMQKEAEMYRTMGNMAPMIAISAVTGGAAGATGIKAIATAGKILSSSQLYLSAAGQATEQAYKSGANAADAISYGNVVGAIELATEAMFSGLGKAVGATVGDVGIVDKIFQKAEGKLGTTVYNAMKYIIDIAGEGVEEFVSEWGDYFAARMIDENIDTRTISEVKSDAWDSFAAGAIMSMFLGASTLMQEGMSPQEAMKRATDQYIAENMETVKVLAGGDDAAMRAKAEEIAKRDGLSAEDVYNGMKMAAEMFKRDNTAEELAEITGQTVETVKEQMDAVDGKTKGENENGQVDRTGTERVDVGGTDGEAEGSNGRLGETAGADRAAEAEQLRIRSQSLPEQSTKSIISEGTETSRLRVIPEDQYDDEMKTAVNTIRERGYEPVIVVGTLEAEFNGQTFQARGYIGEGKIVLQADNNDATLTQILEHELGHSEESAELNEKTKAAILEKYSEEEFDAIFKAYQKELVGYSNEEILSEIIQDARAGINAFGQNVTQYQETVKGTYAQAKENTVGQEANGVRETRGPNWSRDESYNEEKSKLKQQISAATGRLMKSKVISKIAVKGEMPKNKSDNTQWVLENTKSMPDYIVRDGFGDVSFNENRRKDGVKYIRSEADLAAFMAVPDIIRYGEQIAHHEQHKGNKVSKTQDLESWTFAGKVSLNGSEGVMGVVVQKTSELKYKAHRIIAPDGTVFVLNTINEAEPGLSQGATENGRLVGPTDSASADTVTDSEIESKGNFSRSETTEKEAAEAKVSTEEFVEIKDDVENHKPVNIRKESAFSRGRNTELGQNAKEFNSRPENQNVDETVLDAALEAREKTKALLERENIVKILPPDIEGNTSIGNASYGYSQDMGTVCPRSLALDDLMIRISEELGHPLSFEESVFVCQEAMNYTDAPECLYCYVANDRKAYTDSLGKYFQRREKAIQMIREGKTVKEIAKELGSTATATFANQIAFWRKADQSGKALLQPADVAGVTNEKTYAEQKRKELPEELRQEYDMARKYAQSASHAKGRQAYIAYNGNILAMPESVIKTMNRQFGMRMYSFTDYSAAYILENMQQITDAAVRGLKVLAYTKEPDFVRIFAKTGANINMSVFAMKNAVNGEFQQDGMQGMDWEEAKKLREENPNCGVTFVATSDAQVEWAMRQDWIDVVIPYHSVFTGGGFASRMFGWKDYKAFQEDKKTKDWKKGQKKSIYPAEHNNDILTYAKLLSKNNLRPRFESYIKGFDDFIAGNISEQEFRDMNPYYMKLVNETRRSSGATPAVQPIFGYVENGQTVDGLTVAEKSIDEMGKRGSYFPQIGKTSFGEDYSQDIVEETADKMRNGVPSKSRWSRAETTDAQTLDAENRIKDTVSVADEQGRASMEWNGHTYEVRLMDGVNGGTEPRFYVDGAFSGGYLFKTKEEALEWGRNALRKEILGTTSESISEEEYQQANETVQTESEYLNELNREADDLADRAPQPEPKPERMPGENMLRRAFGLETDEDVTPERRTDITKEMAAELDAAVNEGMEKQKPVTTKAEDTRAKVSTESTEEKKTLGQKLKSDIAAFRRKIVNSGDSIHQIAKKTGNKSLDGYFFYALASKQRGTDWITNKRTNTMGEGTGKSLNAILNPIRERGDTYYEDFQLYLYHMLNVERMSRDLPAERAEAQRLVNELAKGAPQLATMTDQMLKERAQMFHDGNYGSEDEGFLEMCSDYWEAKKNLERLQNKQNKPIFGYDVDAEMSKEAANDLLQKNPEFQDMAQEVYDYIHDELQYRVDSGLITKESMDNLLKVYPHYVPAAYVNNMEPQMNKGGLEVSTTIGKAKGGDGQLLPLHTAMARQTMRIMRNAGNERLVNALVEEYKTSQQAMADDILNVRESENVWDEDLADNDDLQVNKDNVISFIKGGKRYDITLSKAMTEAFDSLQPSSGNIDGMNWLASMNDTFKKLTTSYNPIFMITNPIRDFQDAVFYSTDSAKWLKNFPKAYQQIVNGGTYWELWKSMGGVYGSYFNYQTGDVEGGRKTKAGKVVDKIEMANMWVEQAPRLAEFMTVLENKAPNGNWSEADLMEAFEAAQDITTNFSRSGSVGRIINRYLVPFWNPGVQGLSKVARTFTEQKGFQAWARLALKGAVIGIVPSVLNGLLYGGDDEWDDIEDSVKINYYLYKGKDGMWVRIPKGRVISALSAIPISLQEQLRGDDVAWGENIGAAIENIAPENPLNANMFKTMYDVKLFKKDDPGTNWYGGDIESQRLQSYKPGERYDESTDVVSKWIGEKLNLSPKKINYLLDQYSGVIGDIVLPYLTPKAEASIANIPLSQAFIKRFSLDTASSNKISGDYYDMKDELLEASNDLDTASNLAYKYMNHMASDITELYAGIRKIENDTELTDKEKTELTRELKKEITAKQKEIMENADRYQTAAMDYIDENPQMDYYDDKAVKVWMDEYNDGLPENEQITEEQAAKKMADIVTRELDREVFGAEYALAQVSDTVYAKAATLYDQSGISYEDYYEYYVNTKEVKADRAENGKAIGGTKKNKIVAFIDSLELTAEQKDALWEDAGYSVMSIEDAPWNGGDVDFTEYGDQVENTEAYTKAAEAYMAEHPELNIRDKDAVKKWMEEYNAEQTDEKYYIDTKQAKQKMNDLVKLETDRAAMGAEYALQENAPEAYEKAVKVNESAGISYDVYYDYHFATQKMYADKDENGKSISGSKKTKIVAYIDSLDLTPEQKDALWLDAGYTEKSLYTAPWNGGDGDYTSSGGSGGGRSGKKKSSSSSSAISVKYPSVSTKTTSAKTQKTSVAEIYAKAAAERDSTLDTYKAVANTTVKKIESAVDRYWQTGKL